MSQDMLERMSEDMSEDMSKDMSERMSEDMSERMSEVQAMSFSSGIRDSQIRKVLSQLCMSMAYFSFKLIIMHVMHFNGTIMHFNDFHAFL